MQFCKLVDNDFVRLREGKRKYLIFILVQGDKSLKDSLHPSPPPRVTSYTPNTAKMKLWFGLYEPSLKELPAYIPSHPLCRMHVGQCQASSALYWGDREMGTAILCMKNRQVTGLIHTCIN